MELESGLSNVYQYKLGFSIVKDFRPIIRECHIFSQGNTDQSNDKIVVENNDGLLKPIYQTIQYLHGQIQQIRCVAKTLSKVRKHS